MSKFVKVMVALLAIATFVAPAFASDIEVSGQMRVEYYNLDNYDLDDDTNDHVSVFDQRFRLNTNYKPADGVLVRVRMDLGEDEWAGSGQNTIRNEDVVQLDYAYLQIQKEMFTLTAGQSWNGYGNAIAIDTIGTGVAFATKTPVVFKASYYKLNDDRLADEDDTVYALSVGHTGENYSAELFYGFRKDSTIADDEKSVIGLSVNYNLDAIKIKGEIDIFDGDNAAGMDYVGTQAYLDVSTAVSENFALGGFFLYAKGTDDANETQITGITDWDSFMPETYGYIGETKDVLQNVSWNGTFQPGGAGSGVISPAIYGTFSANDDLGFKFLAQYIVEEEAGVNDATEFEALNFNISTKYTGFAPNTAIVAQINYLAPDKGDDALGLLTQLQVAF